MATLHFPNAQTLRLAISSGIVPERVLNAPVRGGVSEAGDWFVSFSADLPRKCLAELKELGVLRLRRLSQDDVIEATCWCQLFDLDIGPDQELLDDKAVLFLLPRGLLADYVAEMLRLGNDRQGYHLVDIDGQAMACLRVIGPPYYSLLRVLEDARGDVQAAYVERAPRIWLPFGTDHPLLRQIQAPVGQRLFIDRGHRWSFIDEQEFRDVYSALDLRLPAQPQSLPAFDLDAPIPIRLSLTNSSTTDAAELWVLRQNALQQIEDLLGRSDDDLIRRLLFSVTEIDGETVVVLRTRPSKLAPPQLVLTGTPYRSYLKIPNLFLPVGKRIRPPLRRDALANHLASDAEQITWLAPIGERGEFEPQSVTDSSFRPLQDWVTYVLDRNHVALEAWLGSHRFSFEAYVAADLVPRPAKKKRKKHNPKRSLMTRPSPLTNSHCLLPQDLTNRNRRAHQHHRLCPSPRATQS